MASSETPPDGSTLTSTTSKVCHPKKVKSCGEEFTQYEIHTTYSSSHTSDDTSSSYALVHKRYSDFMELRRALRSRHRAVPSSEVPSLPSSTSFPTNRFSESVIQHRVTSLNSFLNMLHQHSTLATSPLLKSFLNDEHRSLVYHSFGGLENLELRTSPIPNLQLSTDVLVRVHAASLNPADLKHLEGELKYLVSRDIPTGVGFDFSGEIAAVGSDVADFALGDAVFGDVRGLRTGTVAEYVVVDSSVLVRRPANLSHVQAAGAPLAGLTALQCFEEGNMKHSCSVLITGGAGGVGGYAIQIARKLYHSSFITTTASAGSKTEYVETLGANRVLNYKEDFVLQCEQEGEKFDCVVDCTGEAGRLVGLVAKGGSLVSILAHPTSEMLNQWVDSSQGPGVSISSVISGGLWLLGSAVDFFSGASALNSRLAATGGSFKFVITTPTRERLNVLRGLLEGGQVVPQIDSEWPLSQAVEAARRLATGHARGKVIVNCCEDVTGE